MNRPDLSVVIPVYNEQNRIGRTLEESLAYLKAKRLKAEVILVDDGSSDATVRVMEDFRRKKKAQKLMTILKHPVNRGKGAAVRTGVSQAQGKIVLYMDADNATPLAEIEKLMPGLKRGFEVVIGSRATDRSQVKIHQPLYRQAIGRVGNLLVQLLATPGLWDTQCGFKAFSHRAAKAIFPLQTIERFGFDVELLFIARKKGFQVLETSVQWFDAPGSKVNALRDSIRTLAELFLIRWNSIRGFYDSAPTPHSK
ncbi:MAG TPA: dolichyl-phosphate beta-glucosyltransferase [bacterium]|nr:dolichyl-phosphate beta-glucosyltransferase [bacterium]